MEYSLSLTLSLRLTYIYTGRCDPWRTGYEVHAHVHVHVDENSTGKNLQTLYTNSTRGETVEIVLIHVYTICWFCAQYQKQGIPALTERSDCVYT